VIGDFFREHVDVSHVSSEAGDSNYTKHRAIRLVHIVPELSGSYKCKVSTFVDEDFKQMDMLVYCECKKLTLVRPPIHSLLSAASKGDTFIKRVKTLLSSTV
jgi:hypothetical protein